MDRVMRGACRLAALSLLTASPPIAGASQTAKLGVAFLPNRPGQSTTIRFSAQITASKGSVPAPLTKLTMRYPSALGVSVSGLGLTTCARARLEALGPAGCPSNSVMGRGSVVLAVPFGPEVVQERAQVTIVRGSEQAEGIVLLFYAEGLEPVFAEITFTGVLSEVGASEQIGIDVPLVEGLPGGPDVAVVRLFATIGPKGLTYLERVDGKTVPYRPRGILLPKSCPRGGFRFGGDFAFADGSRATATASVPCRA